MNILLIEDSEADRRLLVDAFRDRHPEDRILPIHDGEAALAYLAHEPDVDLIILDLNVPKKDGLEILQEVRKKQRLESVPVVVLTTSRWQADKEASRILDADAYFVKPSLYGEVLHLVDNIRSSPRTLKS